MIPAKVRTSPLLAMLVLAVLSLALAGMTVADDNVPTLSGSAHIASSPSDTGKTIWIPDPTYNRLTPPLTPPKATETAHWIWLGPVVGDQQFHARSVFTLRSKPRAAQVWITGDDAFMLYLNGHQIEETQPIEQGWSHVHKVAVTEYLRVGKNVLAVKGINKGGGAAGIVVKLDVNGVTAVVSGSYWKAVLTTPPSDWLDASFNDSAWQNATDEGSIGTGVWGSGVKNWPHANAAAWYMAHMTMRPIAVEALSDVERMQNLHSLMRGHSAALELIPISRVQRTYPSEWSAAKRPSDANAMAYWDRLLIGKPVSVTSTGPRQILLDFGRELSGRLDIAGTSGARVEVHTGESREACLHLLKDARLLTIDNSGPWLLTLNGAEVQTTPYTAFRYALLTFPGEQPVTLTKADCDFKYYPVEYKGAFACSDPLLTRIWYTGAYTAHLCMQEDIWDAPKRDRGLWIGDMHVTGETINNVFADRFLMEKSIAGGRASAQGGRPDTQMPVGDINDIPGYTASWFGVLADFYRHDGDLAFLRSQRQNILSLLAYQQTEFDNRNLFSNPKHAWDFCDWVPNYVRDTPQTLATTHLFATYGVRQAVFLLRALGDTANAEKYSAWADTLTQAARSLLINPQTQTYGSSVQENSMAVYADVATLQQQARIYNEVLRAGATAWKAPLGPDLAGSEVMSPFYGNYVLSAYGKMGQYQAGIDLLRRYWGAMLLRGATTWWEVFDPSFSQDMNRALTKMPYVSLCHGWSSGPTSYLTETILGVQPTTGGFKNVIIAPELGDLTWAEGTVPTPQGNIHIHVEKSANGMVCTLSLPDNIHAQVKLPGRTVAIERAGRYTVRGNTP